MMKGDRRTARVGISITPEEKRQITRLAKKGNISTAKLVSLWLERTLKAEDIQQQMTDSQKGSTLPEG